MRSSRESAGYQQLSTGGPAGYHPLPTTKNKADRGIPHLEGGENKAARPVRKNPGASVSAARIEFAEWL